MKVPLELKSRDLRFNLSELVNFFSNELFISLDRFTSVEEADDEDDEVEDLADAVVVDVVDDVGVCISVGDVGIFGSLWRLRGCARIESRSEHFVDPAVQGVGVFVLLLFVDDLGVLFDVVLLLLVVEVVEDFSFSF